MIREVEIGKIYRHFKGYIVKVLTIAKHTETDEILVIYEHEESKKIWARPYDMFNSLVDKEKYPDSKQEYRFESVDE